MPMTLAPSNLSSAILHDAHRDQAPYALEKESEMHAPVATVLDRITREYPGVAVRQLEISETNHFQQDLIYRGVRELDGAFLLATSDPDFVEDENAAVDEMAEIAVDAVRRFGAAPGLVALSLRFEHSKAANRWAPNTLYGVMVVVPR
ncbi:hypothetical protein [Microbacterium phyllosphaerae]|uniref:hypothetical protein n=1 Tax=Microbacterium phyllosphaerae TaxID=124798 RepID=UPI00216928E7|nr:hypothetical protein [Microbacterium phyllosphaerae]